MRWLALLFAGLVAVVLVGCWERPALPFPTPAQHDLVVLIQAGPLTYATDDAGNEVGLERDLIEAFAQELGVGVRYIPVPPEEIKPRLAKGEAHFAAAWFSSQNRDSLKVSSPFLVSQDILVQHEASLPVDDIQDLRDRTVHVLAGSRQVAAALALKAAVPGLQVEEFKGGTVFDLLDEVGKREVAIAMVDNALMDIALQFVPSIQPTLAVGKPQPIAWLFGEKPNEELLARASAFIARSRQDGTLARLEDRYFGHVRRLGPVDIAAFLEKMETVLPKLRRHFQAAQVISGIDWRLIAALAYHESQWDPTATSPTGVRGIMMLTEETADRLKVSNRLDAKESILAGARYLEFLRDQLPASTPEPDRTWMALAAYNLGLGHFNAGRTLAKQLQADPDSWYEMKRILPLLAQPKYYEKLKAGRARGGEAVILAENIRSYYHILTRHQEPYRPSTASGLREKLLVTAGVAPGLKRR